VTLINANPFGDLPKRILRGASVVFVNNADYSIAKTRALLHFLEKHLDDDARLIALKVCICVIGVCLFIPIFPFSSICVIVFLMI
jgi:hypothetical protein